MPILKLKPDDPGRKNSQQSLFTFRDSLFFLNNQGSSESSVYSHLNKRRKIQSTTSAFNLCDDILLEIFVLLPDFPSLYRCSRVCKRWYSLIHDPDFIQNIFHRKLRLCGDYHKTLPYTFVFQFNSHYYGKSHEQKFQTKLDLAMCEKSELLHGATPHDIGKTYLDFIPEKAGVVIRAQFKDLLLVSGPDYGKNYYVCNPLTKQFVPLPKAPNLDYVSDNPFRYGLVCKERNFRVVLFNGNGVTHMRSFTASVFSSETRTWTVLPDVRPIDIWRSPRNAGRVSELYAGIFPWTNGGTVVARGGVVHWLTDTCRPGEEKCLIAAFDPYRSRCSFIDLPQDLRPKFTENLVPWVFGARSVGVFLGACSDRLRLAEVVWCGPINIEILSVWELREDERGEHIYSWRLVHRININGKRIICVIGFHPYDGDIVFVFVSFKFCVCEFNIREQKLKKMKKISMLKHSRLICPIGSSISVVPIVHNYDWPTSVPPLSLI